MEPPVDSATWADLLKSGCQVLRHVSVDGIPVVFDQRRTVDVYGQEVGAPAGYSVSHSLFLDDSQEVSIDCDRERGVAAGRSVDLVLAWRSMEDDGTASRLFRRPTIQTALTTSVALETIIPVADTTGFEAGVGYYLGHEYFVASALSPTSFDGVARGVCGRIHFHTSKSGSGYRYVTDSPMFWRGRLVTIWETLVSPEGRSFGATLATLGKYCRQYWRGYVEEDPTPGADGMVLRCLPLERMFADEIGVKLTGTINFEQGFPFPMGFDASDQIRIQQVGGSADDVGPSNPANYPVGSLYTWCAIAQSNIATSASWAGSLLEIRPNAPRQELRIKALFAGGGTNHSFNVFPSATWFLPRTNFEAQTSAVLGNNGIPLDFNQDGGWLPVKFDVGEDSSIAELPPSGSGVIEVDGASETVQWSEVRYLSAEDPRVALRLSARAVDRTSRVDWTKGGTFRVVAGAKGAWGTAFRRLATSSGLGIRGEYDTLAAEFGLGLDDDDIDIGTLGHIGAVTVDAFAEGKTSVADMLGGQLVLKRLCLVQTRARAREPEDGKIRLALVSTEVPDDLTDAQTIGRAEVILGGHSKPERAPAPNAVKINAGQGDSPRTWIVRDMARLQAERSARTWTVTVPGCEIGEGTLLAGTLMRLSDGLQSLEVEVPPWVDAGPGAERLLTTGHPLVFDWTTGTRAPAAIAARIVGWAERLSGGKRVRMLLAGQASEIALLPPSVIVSAIGGSRDQWRIAQADAHWFRTGEQVKLYMPGSESTTAQTVTILGITTGETEAVITGSDPLGVGLIEGAARVTYPAWADASARQRGFMYVRSDRAWR